MCKCIKSGFSVVTAHAAFAKSAERHFACGKVNKCIVDAASAEPDSCNYIFRYMCISCKNIKCKRMGHGTDIIHGFINRIVSQNRKNRSEDFFLHDSVRKCDIIHNRWLKLQSMMVESAAIDHFVVINQSKQPVKMF